MLKVNMVEVAVSLATSAVKNEDVDLVTVAEEEVDGGMRGPTVRGWWIDGGAVAEYRWTRWLEGGGATEIWGTVYDQLTYGRKEKKPH